MSKMLAHELKACKKDLERFYETQKKSGLYPPSLVKRHLKSMDEVIAIIGGENKNKNFIQDTLF